MRKSKTTLTLRETECIALAAQGYNLKQSAAALSLSPETVKYHRRSAVKRLGCANITHAVFYCLTTGIEVDWNFRGAITV